MQTIIAKQGQSFLDLVLESTGDATNAFSMAIANNASITAPLIVGTKLNVSGQIKRSMIPLLTGSFAPATIAKDDEDFVLPQSLPHL